MHDVHPDVPFMKQALRLAARGKNTTSPNPMVGALVVAKGHVVGAGFHKHAGGLHAEIVALQQARSRARRATLYVTVEPCCHTNKRTLPCVPSILESGIARVVVAMRDPNPHVAGRGIQQLKHAGLTVDIGCLRQEAEQLNAVYVHWIQTGRPFVILKTAMTLDGKIATAKGESQWITGLKAREHVQHLRQQVDAIVVGITTILKDDPQLTIRVATAKRQSTRQLVRVILDSRLRIPLTARVLQQMDQFPVILATTRQAGKQKREQLQAQGAKVIVLPQKNKCVSIQACLEQLGNTGITSVLVEGGSEVNVNFVQGGWVNRVMVYMAPSMLGGHDAKGWLGGSSPSTLAETVPVSNLHLRSLGDDVLIIGDVRSARDKEPAHRRLNRP